MVSKESIKVFLFGSPADGFTAYPSRHKEFAKRFDISQKDYSLKCVYTVKHNICTIYHAEYGLRGVCQDGSSSRGGRNFGVCITIEGVQINEKGQQEIKEFIEGFIEKGIVERTSVFRLDQNKKKFFNIKSFNEYKDELEHLLNLFRENFTRIFNNYFEKINNKKDVVIYLVPPKQVTGKKNYSFNPKKQNIGNAVRGHQETPLDKKKSRNAKISPNVIIILLSFIILILVLRSTSKTPELPLNNITPTQNPNPVPSSNSKWYKAVQPEASKGLKKIVEKYNRDSSTNFSLHVIATLSGIKPPYDINTKDTIKFPVGDVKNAIEYLENKHKTTIQEIQKLINVKQDGVWGTTSKDTLNSLVSRSKKLKGE